MDIKINNRGQVTLFIILAFIIVAGIAYFFFGDKINFTPFKSEDPQQFIEKCMIDSISVAESTLLKSNGFLKIDDNFIIYNQEKIPYLCTTSEYYTPCMPQEPAIIGATQKLIENKVTRETENCFNQLLEDYQDKGYQVKRPNSTLVVEILSGKIEATINSPLYIKKDEQVMEIKQIKASYPSTLFDLLKLEQAIVNYESSLCEFDLLNWQKYENQIFITRFRASDQTKIYTLKDRYSDKQIKFAIRTCVMPAGI
jgi:hypothetical protein